MITGDVRTLARKYCDAGLAIQYDQYDTISHFLGAMLWLPRCARLGRRPLERQACTVQLREHCTGGELTCAARTRALTDSEPESTSTVPPPTECESPTVQG